MSKRKYEIVCVDCGRVRIIEDIRAIRCQSCARKFSFLVKRGKADAAENARLVERKIAEAHARAALTPRGHVVPASPEDMARATTPSPLLSTKRRRGRPKGENRCLYCGKVTPGTFCASCVRDGWKNVYLVTKRSNGWDRGEPTTPARAAMQDDVEEDGWRGRRVCGGGGGEDWHILHPVMP